jgi:hypothetical protein
MDSDLQKLAIDDNSMNRHNHLSPREVVKSAKSER